ncbi:MAG: carboxyltransferase domain-containing protein [Gammaproteobacteria bacterium]
MSSRFSFGGDEHLFVECDEEMTFDAFFKSLAVTSAIREANFPGVSEICPGNASYQLRFDPDRIRPDDLLREVRKLDEAAARSEDVLDTRIVEIPVYYQDPWTHETMMRFRERHQDPEGTDLEYCARINGYDSVADFIAAHHGSPWFVSMVGFVCGVPWLYQMVERARQIEAPKYVRPRTDTPRHTIGHGGCFCAIYAVRGAGGYQMFGITPMPIFEPAGKVSYLREEMVLLRPGDIVKFAPIDRAAYEAIDADVAADRYEPRIRPVRFDRAEFEADMDAYNARLIEVLNHD